MKKNIINITTALLNLLTIFIIYNSRIIIFQESGSLFNMKILIILIFVSVIYFFKNKIKEKYKNIWYFINLIIILFVFLNALLPSINIFSYFLIYCTLLLYSFILSLIFNIKFELSLGFSICLNLIILFILSLLNLLAYSKIILPITILSLIIFGIKTKKIKYKTILSDFNNYIDIKIIIFSIFFTISILNGFERYVNYWDEYNMWALYPKKVIFSNTIKDFGYPPMLALWHYFISLFDTFKETNLYIGNSIFIYSFLLSILSVTKEKFSNILLAIIILAFPFMFPGVYNFNNLYADFSIAAIFGFSLIYIFNSSREKHLSTAIVIMLSTIITLIKPQGFTLAICLIIIYVLNKMINKEPKLKINKELFIMILKIICITSIPVIIYLGWTFISQNFLVENIFKSYAYSPNTLKYTLLQNLNINEIIMFIKKLVLFLDAVIIDSIIDMSIFTYCCIFGVIIYLCCLKKYDKKRSIIFTSVFMSTFIIYYSLTALSLFCKMPASDALNLASFSRYLNNFYVGMFVLLVYFVFEIKHKRFYPQIFLTLFVVCSVSINNMTYFISDLSLRYEKRNTMLNVLESFKEVLDYTPENSKIYIIDQEDQSGYLPQCYAMYYLYPRTTSGNGQINWRVATKNYNSGWEMTGKELEKNLLKNRFDYLFLYSKTNDLFDEIDFMMDKKKNNKDFSLFKIENNNGKIKLIPIA